MRKLFIIYMKISLLWAFSSCQNHGSKEICFCLFFLVRELRPAGFHFKHGEHIEGAMTNICALASINNSSLCLRTYRALRRVPWMLGFSSRLRAMEPSEGFWCLFTISAAFSVIKGALPAHRLRCLWGQMPLTLRTR
jgi:hypothetical protein